MEQAQNNYIQLEDLRIPLEDTFVADSGSIHLPMRIFINLVGRRNLEVQAVPRDGDDGSFPFQYRAKLQKGTRIYAISDCEILFD